MFQCTDKDSGSTLADAGDEWQQPGIFRKFLIHKFHNITILYKHHDNKYNIKTDIAMRTCPFLICFGILLIIIIFQNYHVNEYILLQTGQKS